MTLTSFITNELITKEKLEEILTLANLTYELGGYEPEDECFWVFDEDKDPLLVAYINDVNENGESNNEKESLREFKYAEVTLPIENGHALDIEYSDLRTFKAFINAVKILYPEAYYYNDFKDKFIKI